MEIDLNNLPNDLITSHKIIVDLVERLSYAETELGLLKQKLVLLRAKRFGKSSEKLDKEIGQLELLIEEVEADKAESSEVGCTSGADTNEDEDLNADVENDSSNGNGNSNSNNQPKQQPKRQKLPDHLPRTDVTIDAPSICPQCGSDDFRKISDDISEVLEYVPSSFRVMRYIRPRCVCRSCEHIVQAYPHSDPISKGKAGPGLLAHVITQKYSNHLPLYRQSEIYEYEGVEISRSTMAGWVGRCSSVLTPLVDVLRKEVLSSCELHGDDTPVKVLAPGLGKTKTARIWTYVRDGRPHGDNTPPAVCYFYSPDRKGERPREHLKDFTGILHADAYAGYNKLYDTNTDNQSEEENKKEDHSNKEADKDKDKANQQIPTMPMPMPMPVPIPIPKPNQKPKITEAACWAHTRRKFYEITVGSDNATIAYKALDEIAKLYQIEAEIKGLDPDKRREQRQIRSKEIVERLFINFGHYISKLPKKSLTAQAISYALNNQQALMRFLDNGKIEIDNNAAERALRGIAIGRKNWLFAGSDNGGQSAAAIYSLIETAKLNDIDPQLYLTKVLSIIQDYNSQKLEDLLPWNLMKSEPESESELQTLSQLKLKLQLPQLQLQPESG